jgi:NADH-quinone oxidoreductase subunit N
MIPSALTLLPELLVILTGVFLFASGRSPGAVGRWRTGLAVLVVLVALGLELWLGAALVTFAGGVYEQDRFALFGKAALLLGLMLVLASATWEAERSHGALPLACAATLAGMVAVSATSLPLLWVGLVVAALAGVAAGSLQPVEVGRPMLGAAAAAAGLAGLGLALVGVEGHSWTLNGVRGVLMQANLSPALAVSAMIAGTGALAPAALLPARAWNGEEGPAVQEAILGALVSVTAALSAAKLLGALLGAGVAWGPYIAVLGAAGALICGLAALAAGSLRGLVAWLVTGQVAWAAAALGAHDRLGTAAAVYVLGGLVLSAGAAPLLATGLRGGRAALSGMAHRQRWRWLGLSLVALSLAGAPPLAGFFGEFTVAAELVRSHLTWALACALLGSAAALWAVVRVLAGAWLEPANDEHRLPANGSLFSAALAGVLVLAYGVFAYPIHELAVQGAEALGLLR